jgi:hypothetical protein
MSSVIRPGVCLFVAMFLLVASAPARAGQESGSTRAAEAEAQDEGQQQPKPTPQPTPQLPRTLPTPRPGNERPAERRPEGRPVNLHLEITITDQIESEPAQKKSVSMMVADRTFGRIRAAGQWRMPNAGMVPVQLNVDATPAIQPNDNIRLELTLEYRPSPPSSEIDAARPPSTLNESLTVILQPGKTLTISRAVDPFTNRRTSVDVTATIMK